MASYPIPVRIASPYHNPNIDIDKGDIRVASERWETLDLGLQRLLQGKFRYHRQKLGMGRIVYVLYWYFEMNSSTATGPLEPTKFSCFHKLRDAERRISEHKAYRMDSPLVRPLHAAPGNATLE